MSAGNTGNRQRCNDEQYIYIGNDDVYWGQKTTDKLLKLRRLTIVSLSDGLRVMPSLSAQSKNSRSVGNNNNNLSGWLAVATRTESTWEANPREARVGEQQSDMQSTVRGQRRRRHSHRGLWPPMLLLRLHRRTQYSGGAIATPPAANIRSKQRADNNSLSELSLSLAASLQAAGIH